MNNNPISNVDPNGDNPILIGAAIGFLSNGIGNVMNGNNFFDGALQATFFGAVGGGISAGIGGIASNMAANGASQLGVGAFQVGAHGLSGGLMSAAQGGKFWHGAAAGGFSSGVGSGIGALGGGAGAQWLEGGLSGGFGSAIAGGSFWQGAGQGFITGGLNHAAHDMFGGGPGDPPTKEELKVYLAGEFLNGSINRQEYLNAITLVDDGPWGLFKQVTSNNKVELAVTVFPVGRLGMLGRYFASLAQLGQSGKVIANVVRDAPRLVAKYGGRAGDWRKMTSATYAGRGGFKFSTHWYQNVTTGARVEYKTVLGR